MKLSNVLMKAYEANQGIPNPSIEEPNLDVATAYAVQKGYVEQRLAKDEIGGFKAGASSEAVQKRFGLDAPAFGVLYASGKKTGSPVIELSAFKRLIIETEIGFLVGKSVTEPPKDIRALQQCIQGVMPAIELPDLGFSDMENIKGVDIIASNVATAQFLAGKERSFEGLDLNAVSVTLSLDGEVINEGRGSDAMGDQWNALLWIFGKASEQGWKIEAGHVIITGALGQISPGKTGKYVADYGGLGQVSFEVR